MAATEQRLLINELTSETLVVPKKGTTSKNSHQDLTSIMEGWHEIKMTGKLPERRSYLMGDFHSDYVYIFGG
jgi:hypothetical protein